MSLLAFKLIGTIGIIAILALYVFMHKLGFKPKFLFAICLVIFTVVYMSIGVIVFHYGEVFLILFVVMAIVDLTAWLLSRRRELKKKAQIENKSND